ncbi:MAG: 16S rRNA (uracil(1498)-N(3))-methyltransferase [Gammaproteobacteria bacterium]|nr:16S rRNA (uracil(1498)-N(3))-methyltransferase [Gammaproteobacteria bacterium]NIR85544.1 16S rRNA (uracil(1498)-N(3))-methyltransferase [Gammaproteobacteria bacterium]NIR89803.1 16S rRNA (uracil(1498)-N(3))-methyltransferase [Gammaproteobacteria bacterium]NIU06679.1 16S rRNA (uracil(1498)-N(3))-methyltransferase [Gammaproteobacteria bacterium]NIV75070.1 16S rRNA (uracil(1498)-N(3))-methyltransferase [Gammaproteobacteria bacterium]
MRVSRIYVDQPLASGTLLSLPREAAHYVTRVLRLAPGAPLVLFNGDGCEFDARVETISGARVTVRTREGCALARESPLVTRLGLGVSRGGKRMDFALQKAVELGVSSVTPLCTEHGVVRLDEGRAERRATHWRGVVADACEQCGRNRLPALEPLAPLSQWVLGHPDVELKLLFAPQGHETLAEQAPPRGSVVLLVGPEGGLSPGETEAARRAGFRPVALGPRILRTETAAVAALTAIQLLWGDLGSGAAPGEAP